MTLDRMLERANQSSPEKFAILSRDRNVTYRQLNDQANALANGLLNLGMKRGDVVVMLLSKSVEAVVTFLGVTRAGGAIAPVNMRLKPDTLRVSFNHLNPFAVVADSLYYPFLTKFFRPNHPQSYVLLIGRAQGDRVHSFDDILARETSRSPGVQIEENDVAYLNFTSGTTGIPKAAITTHGNLLWNTKGAVEMMRMDSRDVHLCMFPMYAHPHEIFCRSIYLGGTTVLLDSMYPKTIMRVLEQFRVTCMMAVPMFYKSLFPLGRAKEFDLSSLRIAEAGGMSSPAELCREFEEIFGLRFLPVWGSTETTGIALATSPVEDFRMGSMGKPCPGYEVRVLGPGGREADTDEVGELVISGPGVVQGYFNLPAETEATFHHGACYTGDMVRRDETGFYNFLGRRSGLMKVAGLKVYPTEVEAVLLKHPKIEEAAVIALPDSLRGEIPKAFVVPKPGQTVEPKEVRLFCREHLADYKIPALIEVRGELPKTETGKISHAELTQEAHDALADDELSSLQRRIQALDSKMVDLLNQRVELVHRIFNLRDQDAGTRRASPPHAVHLQALRPDSVISHVIEQNKGPIYDEALEEIFRKIIALDLLIQ
ncbi:MAG TPA: AMP-binding protein [bacterium]